jgi:hypothetical protein
MKKAACTAVLVVACATAPSLADDSDNRQTTTDGLAREEREVKAARENAEKQAKEAREKAEKKAEEPWDIAFGAAL